jgi:hypothetical protein
LTIILTVTYICIFLAILLHVITVLLAEEEDTVEADGLIEFLAEAAIQEMLLPAVVVAIVEFWVELWEEDMATEEQIMVEWEVEEKVEEDYLVELVPNWWAVEEEEDDIKIKC